MYSDNVATWDTQPTVVQPTMDHAKPRSTDWSLPIGDDKYVGVPFGNAPARQLVTLGNSHAKRWAA